MFRVMVPSTGSSIDLASFAQPILINLADRPARLADSLDELSTVADRSVTVDDDVHLIRPVRFADAAGFTRPGFRSNLDAHLRAAQWGRDQGLDRILVLEDDLAFSDRWAEWGPDLLAELDDRPWDIASLGYLDSYREAPKGPEGSWVRFDGQVNGSHAYLVNGPALNGWIDHLTSVFHGRPGDDLQGPMPSDGAINTFTWVDPNRVRLLAVPNLVGTRPTRSDITPNPIDRIPVVSDLAEELRRRLSSRRADRAINFD